MKKGRHLCVDSHIKSNLQQIKRRESVTRIQYRLSCWTLPEFSLFQNLRRLELNHSYCGSLRGLESLKHLRVLTCQFCRLRSLNGIPPFLAKLEATNNALENVDALVQCHGLLVLSLSYNPLYVLPDLHNLKLLREVFCIRTCLPEELEVYSGKKSEIDPWRQATRRHYWVRTWKRKAVIAIFGVAKRRRAIRDVLGMVAVMVWKIK